ncbi:hypothetical protein [Vibrio cholerae]|uniref:hypothetical protein n=1 Tax=Vibrio cholerae TaxID=666 RepID=UPI00130212BE|nr:hypothetical protein [Vibrio cholerae]EGR0073208.1 hypothetical protein [Vibrio cholerae]EJL6764616.1 hypothetical protein [Vibrio cholerae]EJL6959345.1 hypothetical protein [Vibrio cholerae]EKF9465843.1 hypothetical protein [Vibrio cholerae]MCE3055390.1 hypothetical protein [Vibrio cholerae]
MKKLKIFLLVIITIPTLVVFSIFIRNKAIGPEGWMRDDLISELKKMVKNPESLVIRQEYVYRKNDSPLTHIYICGLADARNSFGAYTGGFRFVATGYYTEKLYNFSGVNIETDDEIATAKSVGVKTAFEKVYWDSYCR